MSKPRGKLAACCFGAIGLAVIAAAAIVGYPAFMEWRYGIPLVRTWRDLLEQEPIDLGDGVKVRVGIEAKQAPLWSGVLVYCLAEGYQSWSWGSWVGGAQLGPLELNIREEGSEQSHEPASQNQIKRGKLGVDPPILFAQSIPVTSLRSRQVELRHRGLQVWRRTTVGTSRKTFHPWMPLEPPKALDDLQEASGDDVPFAGTMANRADGIALPWIPGWGPCAMQPAELASLELPLPSLLRRAGEPELSLRRTGKGLELELQSEHELMTVAEPVDQLLARFWLNDQPFSPEPCLPLPVERVWKGQHAQVASRFRLEFLLDRDKLSAHPGDRIGMQLLYMEGGWKYLAPALERARIEKPRHQISGRILQTNRIEFIAP